MVCTKTIYRYSYFRLTHFLGGVTLCTTRTREIKVNKLLLTSVLARIANGIPYPVGNYTDTVHAAEPQGFYRLQIDLE